MALLEALKSAQRPPLRALTRSPRIEEVALVAGAFLATLHAEWRIIRHGLVFQDDAKIHEFWMRKFQDPALFQDPLTREFLHTSGYQPPGFKALYWLASHVIDPVAFGELLPLFLQPLSVWLVYRIVRAHTEWRPAAWIAAALFLVPWDVLRFSGGHARAFTQPILLLTVFFLLKRRDVLAALIPPLGMLFYPPAGLTALGILVLASLALDRTRFVDARRLAWGAASSVAVAVAGVVPMLTGASQELISADEARKYPDFGPGGRAHFFTSSTLDYLKNNYSGFALEASGSILAVSALLLLILRYRNALLLRWEVWCMAIAGLGLFAVAQAVLFHLYLPHRYTYPLLPFFCIVIGVAARPTFEAVAARSRLAVLAAPALALISLGVALTLFPLGPQRSLSGLAQWLRDAALVLVVGCAVGALVAVAAWRWARTPWRAPRTAGAAAALVATGVLVGGVGHAGKWSSHPSVCGQAALYSYLRTLPKDVIVAGDPEEVECIPLAARRPVVISVKLYQPWNPEYFEIIRDRMSRTVRAYYGPSVDALVDLRTRYGADYLVVRTRVRERPWRHMAPYSGELRQLLRTVPVPAALRLPGECQTWKRGQLEVYDLACVAGTRPQ
jgi:hypothetical protein